MPGKILSSPDIKLLSKIAEDSVFFFKIAVVQDDEELFYYNGSCFVYKQKKEDNGYKSYLLTNLHNIQCIHQALKQIVESYESCEDLENIDISYYVIINDTEKKEISEIYIPTKQIYDQILQKNPEITRGFDFAIITLNNDREREFFGIKKEPEIQQGEKIYAFGYPQGLKLSISDGIISHVYDDPESDFLNLFGTIQHNILINPGNSGGPTIKQNGEIIGISTFGLSSGVGLNFSIDIRFIIDKLYDKNFFIKFNVNKYFKERLNALKLEQSLK